jgi:hypothetical protein
MSRFAARSYALPWALVGIAAALFLLVVYGYPRLFPRIDAAHPEHFEKNVAAAMAAGDMDRALRIARRAATARYTHASGRAKFDKSLAHTVYARVLLESGEEAAARAQLAEAVGVRREQIPPYRETRKPYYFAPARLTLGTLEFEQGRPVDAVAHFELARAYAAPASPEYQAFHPALYRAYAELGLWARALEFAEPTDADLDALDRGELLKIARVCEGARNWALAERVAARLAADRGEADYLRGRVALAEEAYRASAAHLERAVAMGHARAAFFLGMALQELGEPAGAIEAYLQTPAGELYRPFALAKAATLLQDAGDATEVLERLDEEIAGLRRLRPPVVFDRYPRVTPVAVMTSADDVAAGGRFPMLVVWNGAGAADPGAGLRVSNMAADDALVVATGSGSVLELQWVENLVYWQAVERLDRWEGTVPGWLDTARDWFELRPDAATRIATDDSGNAYLGITKLTWFYSVPVPVRDDVSYLLAGRVKCEPGKGSIGWQGLGDNERVLFEANLDGPVAGDWTWQAGYMRSQLHWESLRVQLNVAPRAGTVAFDDLMLVALAEPAPAVFDQ